MPIKYKFSLVALCLVFSGVSAAATNVGSGTINLTGTITASTCSVSLPTAITIPAVTANQLAATTSKQIINTQDISLDFKNCSALGDTVTVKMSRDREPASGGSGEDYRGGFNFSANPNNERAPLYYQIRNHRDNAYVALNPTMNSTDPGNTVDISDVKDKRNFSLVYKLTVAATNFAAGPSLEKYVGNYSGNVSWVIEYP